MTELAILGKLSGDALLPGLRKTILTAPREERASFRVAVWNCATGFGRKIRFADQLRADVLIVAECAFADVEPLVGAGVDWVGASKRKGVAVFAREPLRLERLFENESSLPQWAVPYRIADERHSFDLLAVWDFAGRSQRNRVDAVQDALDVLLPKMRVERLVVAGDFNSNAIWDTAKRDHHHRKVTRLRGLGLESAYHVVRSEAHGSEKEATLYWRWNRAKGYHIDYVFLPSGVAQTARIEVGPFEEWTGRRLSDHVPIMVDVPWGFTL